MGFVKTVLDDLTYKVNGLAMQVHSELRPGHRERLYQRRLAEVLTAAGLQNEMEKRVEVYVDDSLIGYMFLDLWVEDSLVVECKAFSNPVDESAIGQVLTYLAATGGPVGMLYNFGRRKLEYKRILPSKNVQEWHKHLYRCIWAPPGCSLPPIETIKPETPIRFSVVSQAVSHPIQTVSVPAPSAASTLATTESIPECRPAVIPAIASADIKPTISAPRPAPPAAISASASADIKPTTSAARPVPPAAISASASTGVNPTISAPRPASPASNRGIIPADIYPAPSATRPTPPAAISVSTSTDVAPTTSAGRPMLPNEINPATPAAGPRPTAAIPASASADIDPAPSAPRPAPPTVISASAPADIESTTSAPGAASPAAIPVTTLAEPTPATSAARVASPGEINPADSAFTVTPHTDEPAIRSSVRVGSPTEPRNPFSDPSPSSGSQSPASTPTADQPPIRLSVSRSNPFSDPFSAYSASGVDITAGNRAVDLMRAAVRSTYGPQVIAGIGAFGGMFDARALQAMDQPVLVASTDGIGTKVRLGAQAGRYAGLGHDIVNHCIDDILVQGARPLFFMDYLASSRLVPQVMAEIVGGMAEACRAAQCVLLGGETAEMPGVYVPDAFDVAGTIVGRVERAMTLPRRDLVAGDRLIGLRSSGPHTNGYSLIRKVFEGISLDTVFLELGVPLVDALLASHRSYLPLIAPALDHPSRPIKALAHLTGGGFVENIPRVLPDGLDAVVHVGNWPVPALFQVIQSRGEIAPQEMYRVFNMGIGMIAVVAPEQVDAFRALVEEETWIIGELVAGRKRVVLL